MLSEREPQARRMSGASSLLAVKERIYLLQKLQQLGAGVGTTSSSAATATKGKYTRNRARAIKALNEAQGRAVMGSSIVPQEENFDPILFLTIVHGQVGDYCSTGGSGLYMIWVSHLMFFLFFF